MNNKHQHSAFGFALTYALALMAIAGCDSGTRSAGPAPTPAEEKPNTVPAGTRAGPESAVPQTEPAGLPARTDLIRQAAELGDEAGWTALETDVAALNEPELDRAVTELEQAVAVAEKEARPVPGLRLALAACYGRKGLAEMAYAAVEGAERDAKAPGVVFNLAVIYGRKALLAGALQPCTLTVESDPPGAVIRVDGLVAGVAPLRLEGVRPGTHRIQAALAGFDDAVSEIGGSAGASLKAQMNMLPAPVPYTVRIEPAGALVAVDGGEAADGTWLGALRPGAYPVEARLRGYKTLNTALSVPVSAVPREAVYRLEPLPAALTINSVPAGGRVMIGGVEAGLTPLRWETLAFDETSVRVVPTDWRYQAGEAQTARPAPGAELSLFFSLPRKNARARIPATPALPEGTAVKLNGKELGRVPFEYGLDYGDYDLELSKAGYETLVRRIRWEGDSGVFPILLKSLRREVPVRTIKVDGKTDDWAALDTILVDASGNDLMPKQPGTDVVALYMARDDKYLYWRVDFADGKPQWQGSLIDDQSMYCDLVFVDTGYKGQFGLNLDLRIQLSKDGIPDSYYQLHKEEDVVARGQGITYFKGADNLEARIPLSSIREMITENRMVYVRVYSGPKNVMKYMMSTKKVLINTGL